MDPAVQRLAASGYPVRRINIDQDRATTARFRVEKIPCFVMVVDGLEVDRVVGATGISRLEQMCEAGRAYAARVPPAGKFAGPATGNQPPGSLIIPVSHESEPREEPRSWVAVSRDHGQAAAPVSAAPAPAAPPPPAAAAAMLAASVRLRIEEADGHSCGTGTIVGTRPGEALVLTCGHIFRDSQGKGRIEVDLFGPHPASRIPGRLVGYDLKRDVGLVLIQTPLAVTAARVAPAGYAMRTGQLVASVGCNNGEAPSVQWSEVIALDRFLGSPNIEVAGQPIVGRSGGGLFSAEGLVLGVCNAADPGQHEGLFAALASIQAELDQFGLAGLYAPSRPATPAGPSTGRPAAALAGTPAGESLRANPSSDGSIAVAPVPRVRIPMSAADSAAAESTAPPAAVNRDRLTTCQQAALDEARRSILEGDEVAIVIRDHRNPAAAGRVIAVHGPTALAGSADSVPPTYPTSLETSQPRTPILEWDKETGWRHHEPLPTPKP
jgi:hypothetical protein